MVQASFIVVENSSLISGATTFSIMTFSIMALSIKGLFATLSINYIEHKWTLGITAQEALFWVPFYWMRDLFIVMLTVITLSGDVLSVVLSVIMLRVMAPCNALPHVDECCIFHCNAECLYAKCHFDECCIFIAMLMIIILSVIMLTVVLLSVIASTFWSKNCSMSGKMPFNDKTFLIWWNHRHL